MGVRLFAAILLAVCHRAQSFTAVPQSSHPQQLLNSAPLSLTQKIHVPNPSALWSISDKRNGRDQAARETERRRFSSFRKALRRLDTLDSAGLRGVALTSGWSDRIKSIHNPKTYVGLSILSVFRWNGLIRNYFFWILMAFLVKWYRARYVFKIPVWDRQPNWNNVITSKEQEKDLKALTCKNCGSTIFIAKSREFFFEGSTGLKGLGCFACGAKGADNFIMDRERIVEDVSDMDDYFEYERPLDFVSRSERKKLLKETGGDEAKANQILVDRAEETSPSSPEGAGVVVDGDTNAVIDVVSTNEASPESTEVDTPNTIVTGDPVPSPKTEKPTSENVVDEGGLDALGMDDF